MHSLHHLPKQSWFDTRMWQKAGDHLKIKKCMNMTLLLSVIKCFWYLQEHKRTRGADTGRKAGEKMTRKRAHLVMPSHAESIHDTLCYCRTERLTAVGCVSYEVVKKIMNHMFDCSGQTKCVMRVKCLDFSVPGGRKTSGRAEPESAWTDDCKHSTHRLQHQSIQRIKDQDIMTSCLWNY